MKTEQKVPKWFEGEVYEEGAHVRNPFTGEYAYLNGLELSIYDTIMGAQYIMAQGGGPFDRKSIPLQQVMRKGLDWFRKNNAEAYMVLLD